MLVGLDLSIFNNQERRIFELLADGQFHSIKEIIASCMDELSGPRNVMVHVGRIRHKVSDRGLLLNFVVKNGRRHKGYQLSRRLHEE